MPAEAAALILRDAYGVPHIFAESEAAGLYAFGYAQAQDRLEALLRNLKQARGELAEIEGAGALQGDIPVRAFRLLEIARERYPALPPQIRADIEAFCAGINRFQRERPGRRPAWAYEVAPSDIVAFALFVNVAFATDPFERMPGPAGDGRGSNAFVIAAHKTASGRGALASLDPHLPFFGFLRWYEAHLACGPLNVAGVTFAGLPFIVMGHNGHVAWANTVNQPDLSDWYEERLVPAGAPPVAYEYDGAARPLEQHTFTFRVRQPDGGMSEVRRAIAYTHHGPLLLQAGNKAYALRKAGAGDVGMFAQTRAQCLARNTDEYRRAISGRHVVLFNHLFADADGHIGYVWGGRIPHRPPGYDFHAPVPGWTSETEWGDPVAFNELPQAVDPPAGFLQNCNDGPFCAAPDVPLAPSADPAAYPDWLAPDVRTLRGRRLLHLLQAGARVSVDDAKAIATDVLDLRATQELPALLDAVSTAGRDVPGEDVALLAECARILAAWDWRVTAEARGPALFAAWLAHPLVQPHVSPFDTGAPAIAAQNAGGAVRALTDAVRQLRQQGVPPDVPWGDIHRHRRGNVDLPLDGGGDSLTPNNGPPGPDGKMAATFGSSFRMVVELGNGPARAWSCAPFGNSDDPASPHYADQMPLATRRRYRRVPFTRDEVEAEATSRDTLIRPEA